MAILTTNIIEAKTVLDAGGLVAIPTETVYGLAANGIDSDAVSNIFKAKGRPSNNPLILHFASIADMEPYIDLTDFSEQLGLLAEAFWPGPLTLLLPKSEKVPEITTAGLSRVAVRIPNHSLTLLLLEQLNYPLAAPSANPSGYISPTTASHVQKQLGNKIDLILDGGPSDKGLESTILGWDENGWPTIYRKGVISAEAIEQVLQKLPTTQLTHPKTLEAPGMLSSHYSPNTKTILSENLPKTMGNHKNKSIGLITFQTVYQGDVFIKHQIVLSKKGSFDEVAQKLYAAMHELDELNLDVIIIEKMPETGVGTAINDRLTRAAYSEK